MRERRLKAKERQFQPPLQELTRFRQGAYRLLGALLLYPEEQAIVVAPEAARHLRQRSPWAAGLGFYGPWDGLLRCLQGLSPHQGEELQQLYVATFGAGPLDKGIPLYESAYLDQAVMPPGWLLAELEREYMAMGLHLSAASGPAPDHAAVELEFVSFLCGQEAEAWEAGDREKAVRAIGHQVKFLEQHPCQWLPLLARAVAAREGSGFYALVVEAARTLVAHDADFSRALAASLRRTLDLGRRHRLGERHW
ncbi:MAG: molecular chaperone [Dehalococcoidia bacterium]